MPKDYSHNLNSINGSLTALIPGTHAYAIDGTVYYLNIGNAVSLYDIITLRSLRTNTYIALCSNGIDVVLLPKPIPGAANASSYNWMVRQSINNPGLPGNGAYHINLTTTYSFDSMAGLPLVRFRLILWLLPPILPVIVL